MGQADRRVTAGFAFSFLALAATVHAQDNWDRWPDPSAHGGNSVWVSYSAEYETSWRDRQSAGQRAAEISKSGFDVAFLSISSSSARPDLQKLSDRRDPFTAGLQYAVDSLARHNVLACAAILSDNFTGSPHQMDRAGLVDHLLRFNASRGAGEAGFHCVATDLEMATGSRNARTYDLWKQFHSGMRERIAAQGSNLKLLAWVQGPDLLIARMEDPGDRERLMRRERITPDAADPTLYDGAFRYFTMAEGKPIFDAVIPMWYFTPSAPYYRRVEHAARELAVIRAPVYLIPGLMVRNVHGLCCPGCVTGAEDYTSRLRYAETIRKRRPSVIGTAVFLWPIPADWTCR